MGYGPMVNLNPLAPSAESQQAATFAKRGMDRTSFDRWLDDKVFKDTPVKKITVNQYGSSTSSGERAPNRSEKDALWQLYQQYGTLSQYDAYAYTVNRLSNKQSPDAQVLADTIAASSNIAGGSSAPPAAAPAGNNQAAPKADAASVMDAAAKRDPGGFGAYLNAHPELRAAPAGNINLWGTLGVDPQAQVIGKEHLAPGTANTMDAMGLMHHGDENPVVTKNADAWLKDLYKMTPGQLLELQQRMWDQGWYSGPGSKITDFSMVKHGRPDAATLEAYGMVLGEAARYNAAGQRVGIDGVIGMGSPLQAQAKSQGAPFEKTNPANLSAALRTQAQQDLGRDATPAETAAFQQQYLSQEEAARRELISAGIANRTEGVTTAGDPGAAAQQFLDSHSLADKVAYGAAVRQQAFYNLLKSPV